MSIDRTVLGNVFGGSGVLQRETFKSHFLCPFFFPLSSFLSHSLFLSLSLSCRFCLDQVLADVKNGFAN